MASHTTIQDILQAEFSPPLDTSLIAAIVADYVSGDEGNKEDELRQLREVLSNLAASAEKELVDEDSLSGVSRLHISPTSIVDDASSLYDYSTTDNSAYTSNTSDSSGLQPFSSALGFLKAVFPHVPVDRLKDVIASHGGDSDALDMEDMVDEILAGEYVRELEERGLDEESAALGYEAPWETVDRKRKGGKQKRQNKKGTTFTFVDIRQQQHVRPTSSGSRPAPPDPWTQLASVASHLATLIPTHPASFFQSIFHSPQYPTPSHALRAALVQIARLQLKCEDDIRAEETPALYAMLEVITTWPKYADLSVEERDQLMEDALFALRATAGDPNTALDVVSLLIDLDSDFSSKEFSWSVYHQPVAQTPATKASTNLPSGPPPVPPPPNISRRPQVLPSTSVEKPRASPDAWKTIPVKTSSDGPHPLSGVIRAYTTPFPARKVRGSGNGLGKGGKGDVGELVMGKRATAKRRAWELSEQRRAALREASKAWQQGTSRNHGGEVAFYFAERARELQQQQHKEQLDAAREMVMNTRSVTANCERIDLHGTVVSEAIAIVREYLAEHGATHAKPLRVITGRGNHSRNGVGVLGPAVKNALSADGWSVDTIDGGLVVRGRTR
ncbi:Smr-domain-containing protein [Trametes elegans]|nr:Smr-domain-containing protein [Trametes elegans]